MTSKSTRLLKNRSTSLNIRPPLLPSDPASYPYHRPCLAAINPPSSPSTYPPVHRSFLITIDLPSPPSIRPHHHRHILLPVYPTSSPSIRPRHHRSPFVTTDSASSPPIPHSSPSTDPPRCLSVLVPIDPVSIRSTRASLSVTPV
jgi:hypothetical protein